MLRSIILLPSLLMVWAGTPAAEPISKHQKRIEARLKVFLELNAQNRVQSEEAQRMLTGEASERWTLDNIGSGPDQIDRVVFVGETSAVAAGFVTRGEREEDLYYYFERVGSDWKISAMRTMAGNYFAESILANESGWDEGTLKDDPQVIAWKDWFRRNLKLGLMSDRQIAAWFVENREMFQDLVSIIRNDVSGETNISLPPLPDVMYEAMGDQLEKPHNDFPAVTDLLWKLNLSSVIMEDDQIRWQLGGFLDDTTGILYSDTDKPPEISAFHYIWVQKLAPKWYLYRTT